jgi:hypothetical protein
MALVLALAASACGTDDAVSSCPADEPAACPSTVPSYATDIAPLLERYCTSQCHNPGGAASDQPLSTYLDVRARELDVKTQIYQCRMPLPPVSPPTLGERVTLLTWFVCGSPNN